MTRPPLNDAWILHRRGPKATVDPARPYAYLSERERDADGQIETTATVFLTNRECPFRCLMCDLWTHTTDASVPEGALPGQLTWALDRLPAARVVKLYNSGNFFDRKAVPPADVPRLAALVRHFKTVIIENHPRLVDARCVDFAAQLDGTLEVAMGLETVHPDVLPRLNKRMTLDDVARACDFLHRHGIRTRAFVLLRPPFLSEDEGVAWAQKTLDWAFAHGVSCCAVIPTRAGNGALDHLQHTGTFTPPRLASLETVLDYGLALGKGRVFADLWDLQQFADCPDCLDARRARLDRMNLTQHPAPPVACTTCSHGTE